MGIIFSVNDSNIDLEDWQESIIERFFESMTWNVTTSDPIVAEVPYGELMMMVDTSDRWVYKGSVTTPPCDGLVYWNVLRTIYPIKQKYLDGFKNQLKRGNIEVGNYREVNKIDDHDLRVIMIPMDDEDYE